MIVILIKEGRTFISNESELIFSIHHEELRIKCNKNKIDVTPQLNEYKEIKLNRYCFLMEGITQAKIDLKLFLCTINHEYSSYRRIVYTKGKIGLGCSPNHEIRLNDSLASMNLELSFHRNQYSIKDMNATSFLIINGIQKEGATLSIGDHIQYLHWHCWVEKDFLYMNLVKSSKLAYFEPTFRSNGIMQEVEINSSFRHVPSLKTMIIEVLGYPILKDKAIKVNVQLPQILMAFSAIGMASINIFRGVQQNRNALELVSMLLFPLAMSFGVLVYPNWIRRKEKKLYQQQVENRLLFYRAYLDTIKMKVTCLKEERSTMIKSRYPERLNFSSLLENHNLFQKKSYQGDFLILALGMGEVSSKIELQFNKASIFHHEDLDLIEMQDECQSYAKKLENSVIEDSLLEYPNQAFVGEAYRLDMILFDVIAQIVLQHDPKDVKCVFVTRNPKNWDSVRTCPHFYAEGSNFRFFIQNQADANYAQSTLIQMLQQTKVIIFFYECDSLVWNEEILVHPNLIQLQFVKNREEIEGPCDCIVDLTYTGRIHYLTQNLIIQFSSFLGIHRSKEVLLKMPKPSSMSFSSSTFGLLASLNYQDIDQIPIKENWENPTANTLQATLGLDKFNQPIQLNLDQQAEGPHGLIAGCTGSGKSELILSFVLSLAIRYSPMHVQFVMIDFKGGSSILPLSNSLYHLPHLTGFITNVQENELERSLLLLKKECHVRQTLFYHASHQSASVITDLSQYRKVQKKHSLTPLAELLIIVDEFAEMKKEYPHYLQELITIARTGRSLGMHLILATQKPAGVVDEQIWSNINFRICLKVQETKDSKEVLHHDKAAYINKTGYFYLQTSNQSTEGTAAYSHQTYQKKEDFFEIVNHQLKVIASLEETQNGVKEIEKIVPYLNKVAKINHYLPDFLWHPIPKSQSLQSLRHQYQADGILGIVDDIENRRVFALTHHVEFDQHCLCLCDDKSKIQQWIKLILQNEAMSLNNSIHCLLCQRKEDWNFVESYMDEIISFQQEESLVRLFHQLHHDYLKRSKGLIDKIPFILIIEDLSFLQMEQSQNYLVNLLKEGWKEKIYIFAAIYSLNGIRSSWLDYFYHKITLSSMNRADQFAYFQCALNTSQQLMGLSYKKELVQFALAIPDERFIYPMGKKSWNIAFIPDYLNVQDYAYQTIPLGIDRMSGELVQSSGRKMILITGMYQDSLETFRRMITQSSFNQQIILDLDAFLFSFDNNLHKAACAIRDNKVALFCPYSTYASSLLKSYLAFEEIVWLGNGVNQQHLIYSIPLEKGQLKDNEGIVSLNGRQTYIRCFDTGSLSD